MSKSKWSADTRDRDGWDDKTRIVDPPPDTDERSDDYVIVMLRGWAPGRSWPLRGSVMVGRDPNCSVSIEDDSVSRRHGRFIRRSDGSWVVQDLDSRNGTLVNGHPVMTRILAEGDRIQFGETVIFKFSRQDALERQLAETQKMVAVGRLAAGVAHDYNNVLQVVLANASLLLHAELQNRALSRDDRISFLQGIHVAASKAATVTRQLLDFAGQRSQWHTRTDLSDAVRGTLKMAGASMGGEVEIESDIQEDVAIEGDPGAISQAMLNLLVNARDAMPDGGKIQVSLSVRRLTDADASLLHPGLHSGLWADLSVADCGEGMPEDVRARIFEPFYTTKLVGQGTGLGLAMVDGIVRRHGGHIAVDSEPDRGTIFHLYLPARLEAPQPVPSAATISSDGRSILVVDDDDAVRAATVSILDRAGYRPLQADGGEAAMEVYAQLGQNIDLVLLDLAMPGMSGMDTLLSLRRIDPDVKVVVCSGYGQDQVQKLLKAGALGFLPKPFSTDQLNQAVREADIASM